MAPTRPEAASLDARYPESERTLDARYAESERMLHNGGAAGTDEKYDIPLKEFRGPDDEEREKLYEEEGHQSGDETHIEHGRCGVGRCSPAWAQRLANLPLFVMSYGLAGIWMSALGPLLGSQITSIERHLGLSTSNTGLIMSANDIGYLLAVVIGSYVGKQLHIPRTLCVSAIIFGLSSVVMALGKLSQVRAELLSGQNSSNSDDSSQQQYLCSAYTSWVASPSNATPLAEGANHSEAGDVTRPAPGLNWAFWLFMMCAAVGGVVKSYRFPLFTYYVESNVKDSSSSALLLGTSFSAMVFGPPIAILLGAYVSSIHVQLKDTGMSQLDQRWVGAWWIGFLVVGVACIVSALPVMCFPRHVRKELDTPDVRKLKEDPGPVVRKQTLSDLLASLKRILSQPLFVLTLISGLVEAFIGSGAFAFSQKYMEVQFNKSPQQVSVAIGIPVIFTLASGTFLGGLITTRLRMGLRGCVIAGLLRSIALLIIQCLYFVFGCSNTQFYEPGTDTARCECSSESPLFVCGDDQLNYYSPCVAGCTNSSQNSQMFTNCSRLDSDLQQVKPGLCDDGCPYFLYFVATACALAFISCLGIIPSYIQTIRTVKKTDQALAMGTAAFCATLLGTLPSPVVYGKIIDSTCEVWSPVGGYCLLYNKESFRLWFVGVGQVIRVGHVILISVILWLVLVKKFGSPEAGGRNDNSVKK
ncbi:hypothetical protein EGW08_003147 [Elysia chlorotica]|uniref:Solute carrier organic anion transporter family member n=1 Tax=Elysia chlorotica TaxID=188477 RepID=A0A3S1ADF2_ELYCH|nr:hypothetical protein EGW08_003147 [Elysia chlorotica]